MIWIIKLVNNLKNTFILNFNYLILCLYFFHNALYIMHYMDSILTNVQEKTHNNLKRNILFKPKKNLMLDFELTKQTQMFLCRYFVAALSVACLYSIISTLASISIILKPSYATKFLLYFVFWDVVRHSVSFLYY